MSLGLILFILSLLSFVGLAVYYRKKIKWFFKKHNITWKKIVAVLTGGLLVVGSIVYLSPSPAPPGAFISTENLGYELLDNNEVLYIWNQYNDYYFNVSNGIQFSNHYLEYWTTNVLMLGYYNGDDWNLIYRTDELSGFTKDITGETDGYINATIWKDLSYGSYDFRLAIRYYLGVNDSDLTVIPYIKNLGQAIPYVLGFGWEMKDIQIDATSENDYIDINRTSYYLNQTLNNTYTNLSFPIFNESGNITGWTNPKFEICENITDNRGKYLYLTWDRNLTYRVTVKNRTGQYNAPTTLFVRVGTLGVDQEKFTKMHWLDAATITFYFDNYDIFEAWTTDPEDMVDGDENDYASTGSASDVEYLISNSWVDEDLGEIVGVELRCKGYHSTLNSADIWLRPVFKEGDGDDHVFDAPLSFPAWSDWFDITSDPNAPEPWGWPLVDELKCDVIAVPPIEYPFTLLCSQVEIRVTYTAVDTDAPSLDINFAGNLSDAGGPHWNPTNGTGESLALAGDWFDGYYTNNSKQTEGYILVNTTITDASTIGPVWFNLLNETTWVNWTYQLVNVGGDYWEINTSANFSTGAGYNYSFNIVANDSESNSVTVQWNKTGLGGAWTRRYVQLNYTADYNISYKPYYYWNSTNDISGKLDRLVHDQSALSTNDSGLMESTSLTDEVQHVYCGGVYSSHIETDNCTQDFVLNNIYFHAWTFMQSEASIDFYFSRARNEMLDNEGNRFDTLIKNPSTERKSNMTYPSGNLGGLIVTFNLTGGRVNRTEAKMADYNFTENTIYELYVGGHGSGPEVISNRSFMSFVILNVPDDIWEGVDNSTDSDNDGLSDHMELNETYGYFTNPFVTDTDNDGVSDYGESMSGSDPNNYTDTIPYTPPSEDYYNTTVRVTGEDYFIWMGSNVSAFHVVQNLTTGGAVFDESNEYVSIWNESGTWNADWYVNGTWYEYHPHNSSGNNFSVYTFDVVRVMLSDSGTAWCNVTYNSDVDYTVSRTVSLVNNSDNKGGNFTGYTNSTSTTLSAIVSSIGLDAGENIWLWNETTYTWNVYIVGFWTPVVAVHQNSTIFTKVEDTETWTFGGV